MPVFLVVDADDKVVGWKRTPTAPADTPTETHIEIDETQARTVIQALRHPDRGGPRWRWAGRLEEVDDVRFPVRVTQTPNPAMVGQPVTVRLEVLNQSGQVRAGLNRAGVPITYTDPDGRLRRASLDIVSGVAERTFTPQSSGDMELQSDRDQVRFVGDNPVVIVEDW